MSTTIQVKPGDPIFKQFQRGVRPRDILIPRSEPESKQRSKRSKVQEAYARHLEQLKASGGIKWYCEECVNIRVGLKKAWFKVDFVVLDNEGRWLYLDAKGRKGEKYWTEEDAQVKLRAAALLYPHWIFGVVWPNKGGGWNTLLLT